MLTLQSFVRAVPAFLVLAAGSAGVFGPACCAAAQPSFVPLGDIPGGRGSRANGISADASVVAGFSYDSNGAQHASRWTKAHGFQTLFTPGAGTDLISGALGISGDGLTFCGFHAPTAIEEKAFIWSAAAGESLFATRSAVQALNADGSVGCGYVVNGRGNPRRAAVWNGGNQDLIDSPGTIPTSDARAFTADGTVAVGQAVFGTNMIRAFRWTAATGMVNIGSPDFSGFSSHADGITPDGSVIVGAMGGGVLHPARLTSSGWEFLTPPIGSIGGSAYAVSADGHTIVGSWEGHAFIWRQGIGFEDLASVVSPPAGWTLTEARAISADGRTIVGNGSQVGGFGGAWMVTLPCFSIDAPASVTTCSRGAASLTAHAPGASEPATYQWSVEDPAMPGNWIPLADGPLALQSGGPAWGVLSGASSATLSAQPGPAGAITAGTLRFQCTITNSCGSVTSTPAAITLCRADFNCDGDVNPDDLGDFITCFFTDPPCSGADFNADGDANPDDLGDYITTFFGPGC